MSFKKEDTAKIRLSCEKMLLKSKQGKYFEANDKVEKHPKIYSYSKEMNGDN